MNILSAMWKKLFSNNDEQQESESDRIKRMKQSSEPWIEIVGEATVDEGSINEAAIEMKFEWNDAFITYLKVNGGYSGASDEQIVHKWLRDLYRSQVVKTIGAEFL